MNILGFILVIILLIVAILLVLVFFKLQKLTSNKLETDVESTKNIVNQVFGQVTNQVLSQTRSVLEQDKQAIYKDNQNNRQVIEKMVMDLKKEIDERQVEIRTLEKDRNKKFGEITTAIDEHRKLTEELKTSTQTLAKVLSNNQARGQWGERIIEDILINAGLIEGTHYLRQTKLGQGAIIPDITLLLPNQRKVAIDVKFPYSEIQKMALADNKKAKDDHKIAFARDLKEKVNQIHKRGYIDLDAGTLDYAIMFVPNEMLFSYINQQFPEIIDEAMNKKIMIVSPFTFLIVARTVMESYRNFMIENNLRKIISHIHDFIGEWERFTKEFDSFDDSITKMRTAFDKITTTRYKRMDMRIRRIQSESQGTQLVEEV